MRKKKTNFLWIWMILAILFIVLMVRHFHIKNLNVVQQGFLYTSGQPVGMDYLRLLYKYHIATFVNLRIIGENREDNWYTQEVEWMKSSGVRYYEIPLDKHVTCNELANSKRVERFLSIMNDGNKRPVLLHDSSGKHRVAMLTGIWMLKSGNFNLEDTIKKVQHIKKEPLTDEEKEFFKTMAGSQ